MLCTVCGHREVSFARIYSGERLCKECFTASVMKRVRKTISKYNMFKPDDRIAVAVSGGKDSLALLYILHSIEKDFPKAQLFAITVDEGIPGYRDEAMALAENACNRLGLEQFKVNFKKLYGRHLTDIAEKIKGRRGEMTPCSFCGVLRRKALNITAKKLKATRLATAHNLDDEVQTMLINVIHGDAMRIARVEPVLASPNGGFIPRVKPFCEILESEVTLYAYLENIEFQSAQCPYASYALRTEIREFVNRLEARHPGAKFTIFRSFEKLRAPLKSAVKFELKFCHLCGEPAVEAICESCRLLGEFANSEVV